MKKNLFLLKSFTIFACLQSASAIAIGDCSSHPITLQHWLTKSEPVLGSSNSSLGIVPVPIHVTATELNTKRHELNAIEPQIDAGFISSKSQPKQVRIEPSKNPSSHHNGYWHPSERQRITSAIDSESQAPATEEAARVDKLSLISSETDSLDKIEETKQNAVHKYKDEAIRRNSLITQSEREAKERLEDELARLKSEKAEEARLLVIIEEKKRLASIEFEKEKTDRLAAMRAEEARLAEARKLKAENDARQAKQAKQKKIAAKELAKAQKKEARKAERIAKRDRRKSESKKRELAKAEKKKTPPVVAKAEQKRSISDFKNRVTITQLAKEFFKKFDYQLLAIGIGGNEPVFKDRAPSDLTELLQLTKLKKENFISDRQTSTVIVRRPELEGAINIGEAFVSSEYGFPLQMVIPVTHDKKLSLKGTFSSDSHYINTIDYFEIDTNYGTLLRIFGDTAINNGFSLTIEFTDRNGSASAIKDVYISPKKPSS